MSEENDKPKSKEENKGKDETKRYDKKYPENGENSSAGKEETGALPNNPAKNANLTSPEEDAEIESKD